MASYDINNGDTVTIDETLAETIDYINVNDGICNITNSSNKGLILEFASNGYISVKAFGQLNIRGSMIELGASDGTRGYSVAHWQSKHPINVIWVETEAGADTYLPWYAINTPGTTLLSFDDFPDSNITGRVFEWDKGTIKFSKEDGKAFVPGKGCKIKVPNIILSTTDPFGSSRKAKFLYDEGGHISIKDMSFSYFYETLKGMGHLDLERVGFYGATYVQYCNDFNLRDVHAGIQSNYSTGISFGYSSNGSIQNISGMSVRSEGVTFNYLKNINANNIVGIVAKRDSATDFPVLMETVQGSYLNSIHGIGGAVKLSNVSNSKINRINTIANTLLSENPEKACSNLDIENSSDITIRNWTVPKNGGAKLAYLRVKNSPNVKIVKSEIHSSYANNVIAGDVSFETQISELYYEGYSGNAPFFFPAKNNGLLLQHITTPVREKISIEAPNTIIKGADASSIKTDNPNAYGSNFAQLYTSDTDGELIFIMAKDSNITKMYSNIVGGIKFSNNGQVYFSSPGDSIEITTPYRIKGVTFKNVDPVINGYGAGELTFDYAIDLGHGYGEYKTLNAKNLSSEPIDPENGFMMKIKIVAGDISATTYISSIELSTVDSRYVYPLDFEKGRIIFNEIASADDEAKYFVYYADGYGTANAVMVKDADGQPITGMVDHRDHVDFTYDFAGDDSNGRTPDTPVEMVVVLAGTNMAKNIVIRQVFDKGQLNVFALRPERDYGYVGA